MALHDEPAGPCRPRWRLMAGREIGFGPGKADLLEAIDQTGSISGAAVALGMSYRRAWLLIATMNRCFRAPLVSTSRQRRRGAGLTDDGRRVLKLYRAIESRSLASTRALRSDLIGMLR